MWKTAHTTNMSLFCNYDGLLTAHGNVTREWCACRECKSLTTSWGRSSGRLRESKSSTDSIKRTSTAFERSWTLCCGILDERRPLSLLVTLALQDLAIMTRSDLSSRKVQIFASIWVDCASYNILNTLCELCVLQSGGQGPAQGSAEAPDGESEPAVSDIKLITVTTVQRSRVSVFPKYARQWHPGDTSVLFNPCSILFNTEQDPVQSLFNRTVALCLKIDTCGPTPSVLPRLMLPPTFECVMDRPKKVSCQVNVCWSRLCKPHRKRQRSMYLHRCWRHGSSLKGCRTATISPWRSCKLWNSTMKSF